MNEDSKKLKNKSKLWKNPKFTHSHRDSTDEVCRNKAVQAVQECLERIQRTGHAISSLDSDLEIVKSLVTMSEFTVKEIVCSTEVKPTSNDDASALYSLRSLFTYISFIEKFISLFQNDAHKYEATSISIRLWNDATYAITILREKYKYPEYTNRKISSLKSFSNEIKKSCSISIDALQFYITSLENKSDTSILFSSNVKIDKILAICENLLVFFPVFGAWLDWSEHVERLVNQNLLFILELDANQNENGVTVSTSNLLRLQTLSMECIERIVRWKQHSSSLLHNNGTEEVGKTKNSPKLNGFRDRIWSIFYAASITEFNHTEGYYFFLRNTCLCFATLLENIYSLEIIKSGSGEKHTEYTYVPKQIDLAHFFKWIHQVIQLDTPTFASKSHSLKSCSLDLLRALMLVYPNFCAQFWALFLPQISTRKNDSKLISCNSKSTRRFVTLITIIDSATTTVASLNEKISALKCSKQLVSSLPLQMWSSSGYMSSRVETSLREILEATIKTLSTEVSLKELQASYSLSETLITCIPYHNYKSLTNVAANLMRKIGHNYTLFGLHGGLGLIENAITLTECLGGKETPSGNTTPLPLPSKAWLEGEDSSLFLGRLYSIISEIAICDAIEKGTETTVQMELFIRLIRAMPNLMRNDVCMDTFSNLTLKLLSSIDNKLQLTGATLVRSFVEGRTDDTQMNKTFPVSIAAKLRDLLVLGDMSVKCCVLCAYGTFRFSEWNVLLFDRHNPLDLMLSLCIESNNTQEKVRSEACKALGNMISVCINDSNSEVLDQIFQNTLEQTIHNILTVTSSAVQDSDSNVRSMALFAIGNIALDISRSEKFELVTKIPLLELCDATYQRLFDDGEKVISNAIRTAGHLFNLLSANEKLLGLDDNLQWLHLCGDFALELGNKMNQAISDSINSSTNRSWKQRSNAKKHAWGSCLALQSVLLSSAASKSVNFDGVKCAVEGLISSVSYSDRLNEKIVYGAIDTLLIIPPQIWTMLSRDARLKGKLMYICLSKLQSVESLGLRKSSFEDIMSRLLRISSDQDLLALFELSDVNQLNFLYKWMVNTRFESSVFILCFRTLRSSHQHANMALIQRYASRAIFEARKDKTYAFDSRGTEISMEDDDEEDEI